MTRRTDMARVRAASLFLALMLVPSSAALAGDNSTLEARLHQVMRDCGRPGYVLKPVAGKRLIITALPYIRQTPLSETDMKCIRREVHKIGWRLAADGRR